MDVIIRIEKFFEKLFRLCKVPSEYAIEDINISICSQYFENINFDISFVKKFLSDLYQNLSMYKIKENTLELSKITLGKFLNDPEKFYKSQQMEFNKNKTYVEFSVYIACSIYDLL